MPQLLLIRGAKQLLTLRGPSGVRRGAALHDLAIIEDGSVLIRDGLIDSVGSTRRIENLKAARGALEIAVNGAIVLPAFVDPSIELASAAAIARSSFKQTRSERFHEESVALMRGCLQHGTLHAQVAVTADGSDLHTEMARLRNLADIGNHPISVVRSWRVNKQLGSQSIDSGAAISLMTKRRLVQALTIDPELGESLDPNIWRAAGENRICTNLLWPGGSSDALCRLLDRVQPTAVSSPWDVTTAECAALAHANIPVIFSPTKCIAQDNASGSLQRLASSNAAIALSSGYNAREMPVFNMQMAIALAVLRLGLTTEQAIVAATLNAAHALGCAHSIGSLEVGKCADLLVMNLPDYREIPRRFGMNHVGMVIREGRIVFNRTGWKASAA